MAKADDIKGRVKGLANKRSAHSELLGGNKEMGVPAQENVNVNENIDINNILKASGTKKKSDKELVGIYFEPKVKSALDAMQQAEGRGAKSEFVNDVVKWALLQKGYEL